MGRPRAKIDYAEIEKMGQLQATDVEIASVLGLSQKTIQRLRKDPKFLDALEQGKAKGRLSLRRMQMRLASEGNATMCIWLGKQLLGQRDQQSLEHAGPQGGRMVIELVTIEGRDDED